MLAVPSSPHYHPTQMKESRLENSSPDDLTQTLLFIGFCPKSILSISQYELEVRAACVPGYSVYPIQPLGRHQSIMDRGLLGLKAVLPTA